MYITASHQSIGDKYEEQGLLDSEYLLEVNMIAKNKLISAEVDTLQKVCEANKLSIRKKYDKHVKVVGTSEAFRNFFGTAIHSYRSKDPNDKTVYYSHKDFNIPASINFIIDVIGLNNMPIARPYFQMGDLETVRDMEDPVSRSFDINTENLNSRATALTYFTPIQVANLYKINKSYNGKGQTIAIIELGGGYNQTDMTSYFRSLGLSTQPKIVSVSVDGAFNNPSDTSGANVEVVLDIQIAGAIANAATIVVYFAPNTFQGFYNAIYKAINDTTYKPSIVSISWGAPESYWTSTSLTSFNNLFATAVTKGINVFVASGDNGSTDGVTDGLQHVDFPASSPNVIACGGTTLSSDGVTIFSEKVWNNNPSSSTGGGFSATFAKPAYQNNISVIQTKRGVPDIAGNADPTTGYLIYMARKYAVVAGTSAVAPLWAGITARLNQMNGKSIGFANTNLYLKKPCTDITVGSNGAYQAAMGWDPCTGLGSPNGNNMALMANTSNINQIVKSLFKVIN